ncbi:MAG: UDP-N-acetylmuramoyl-L-alanyl-D-glutamate--2,6-diaminopimelate ligase [Candidatus Abyssubacteria bacterium]|nr:UDP-N-acetylmuramoyl-L-alanyl-D-glutamate--2,6-diaminopimelate ligase [Candidatus Abyssubacteria bacterium]
MKLSELAEALQEKTLEGNADVEITGVSTDSRTIQPGNLFVAIAGSTADGHRYMEDALKRGAVALAGEASPPAAGEAAFIRTPNSRIAAALLAEAFHGYPSRKLSVVGITGTNGKSSTLYLIRSILSAANLPSSAVGTISYSVGDTTTPALNTTPGPVELSSALRKAVDAGHEYFVMEVSSHALHQYRVEALRFKVAVFTNLSLDHLDYHISIEEYFKAKRRLFELLPGAEEGATAVISADDSRSEEVAAATAADKITFGIKNQADIRARNVKMSLSRTSFDVATPQGEFSVSLKLLGRHSVYNALAATGACLALGIDIPTIKAGLEALVVVPGRFERIREGQVLEVIVDYAHTPEALESLLESARSICKGKLIIVFGAGGDRDRSKRPKMGELAAKLSDFSVVTSDNPRTEDLYRIALDIEIGFQKMGKERGQHYLVIVDRREAIEEALATAEVGDIVIIAGKGHETYQIFKDKTIEFDDRTVVRDWLRSISKLER